MLQNKFTASAVILLLAALGLGGCATPGVPVNLQQKQVLMSVAEGESQTHFSPGPEAVEYATPEQYRWVKTVFRYPGVFINQNFRSYSIVPKTMREIETGALVLVYMPTWGAGEGKVNHAPRIVNIVCDSSDLTCGKKLGDAIRAGKLPDAGRPLTPAQVKFALSLSTRTTHARKAESQTIASAGDSQ